MRILVTGANGQVGHCLEEALKERGWDFVALTRADLDISDAVATDSVVAHYRPQVIINAAAYTAVDKAEQEETLAFAINRDGAANLARAAKRIDAAMLHISTDYVFAGDADADYCYRESDATSPQGVYGRSKRDGELAVMAANDKHLILRTAWVFGEHGNNFVKTMLRLGASRDSLSIVADQQGGPTYAGDIAQTLLEISHQYLSGRAIPWGIYHYAGAPHTHWYDFARHIFAEAETAGMYAHVVPQLKAIATTEYPTPAKRPANSKLDCRKLEQTFGIAPSDWRAALKNIRAYSV